MRCLLGLLIVSGLKLLFRSGSFNSPWNGQGFRRLAAPASMIAAGYIFFVAGEALFKDLVLNSAISFEAFKILDMTFMSLAGFIAVMLLLTVPMILFLKAGRMMKEWPLKTNLDSGRHGCAGAAGGLPAGYRMHRLGHNLRAAALSDGHPVAEEILFGGVADNPVLDTYRHLCHGTGVEIFRH
ncbi:MAG: hypothetical protein MZV63_18445 [Marinilabiliales bacterium]|nr:hypothetical protein [Marinilabiliales bacterium]